MRASLIALLAVTPMLAHADEPKRIVPPEIVRVENVKVSGDIKSVIVGNDAGQYQLACNMAAQGCETPLPGRDYYLFNKDTFWKLPGAEDFITLRFIQDWTVNYKNAENIGLVPKDTESSHFGIYYLDTWVTKKH